MEVESWPEPESPEVEGESWARAGESRGGGGVGPSRRVPGWRWRVGPSRRVPGWRWRVGLSRRVPRWSSRVGPSRRVPRWRWRVDPSRRVPRWRWRVGPSRKVPRWSSRVGPNRKVPRWSSRVGPSRRVPRWSSRVGPSRRVPRLSWRWGVGPSRRVPSLSWRWRVGPRGSSQEQPKKENYTKYVTFIVTSQWGVVVHTLEYAENYEQKILIFIYVTHPRSGRPEVRATRGAGDPRSELPEERATRTELPWSIAQATQTEMQIPYLVYLKQQFCRQRRGKECDGTGI